VPQPGLDANVFSNIFQPLVFRANFPQESRPQFKPAVSGGRFMKRVFLLLCAASALESCGNDKAPMSGDPETLCPEPTPGFAPTDVFCTGLYQGSNPSRHAPDAQPYLPGYTLWSDGAEKHRFLYLPPGSTIDTSNMDEWRFPVGTKAWKEFRLDGALVETRLLWKQSADADWITATYIWDAAGTSATLNTSHAPVLTDGGYEIPNQKNCDKCHAGGADTLLGVEAILLALPKAEGITLTSLAQAGALSAPPAMTTVTLPDDASGKAADVVGYLHVNCGVACHSLRGLADQTSVLMRLRAEQFFPLAGAPVPSLTLSLTDMFQTTVGQPVKIATFAETFPDDTAIITAGAHDRSLLWRVAHTRGTNQMPPIVSHKIDEPATTALAAWIDALAP
jgi:hypothetical protein